MILTIYDLSGIQSYIFATNKLKDMIGASFIVNEALFKNIPKLFGEKNNDWEKEAKDGKPFDLNGKNAKTIYIGGGNALVMYENQTIANEKTRELQKKIFEDAGGSLKLCTASIELNERISLSANQKKLMDLLDTNKRKTPNVSTAKGFSINAHDNVNFEPVLRFGDKFATKSKYLKNEMYYKKKRENGLNIFKDLDTGNLCFVNEFDNEKDKKSDEIVDDKLKKLEFIKKDSKNYIAVIHMDGNTMGMKIREFVKAQEGKDLNAILAGLGKLKKLSYEINTTYNDVLSYTIKEIYKNYEINKDGEKFEKFEIPFRPVILDGDDVTVICAATDAFKFVDTFMRKLGEKGLESLQDFKLTAAAGIAFVNIGFPFYTAYDIAEQCCKNAKKVTLKRKDREGREYKYDNSKSSMDFQICYSGVTGSISDFRETNYTFSKKENNEKAIYILNIRPYTFVDDNEAVYSYNGDRGFEGIRKAIVNKTIARSKLKGLRNEYGASVLAAKTYGNFLLARAEGESEEAKKTAELLSEPFFFESIHENKDGEKESRYYAKFFDVLDVLDFIESEQEENKKDKEEGKTDEQ